MLDRGVKMVKTDLKRQMKELYNPSAKEVTEVTVPSMTFLMIDGAGDPNASEEFQAAVEAVFAVSYSIKFLVRKGPDAADYAVMPLEGLWWADDMRDFAGDRSSWKWTAMIMQPSFVERTVIDSAIAQVKQKKNPAALAKMRVASLEEGRCAQLLHVGPFSAEGPAIERVHAHIRSKGKQLAGKHHEIYLSDFRKVDSSKWKTVIRQPML